MIFKKCILMYNDCYQQNKKVKPMGIMIHDTAAGNPNIGRYVQPVYPQLPDKNLSANKYGNHWNVKGFEKCMHICVGKNANGDVDVYQTLPFDIVGWHSGSGALGFDKNANNSGYIGIETCDDGYKDFGYINQIYETLLEICTILCLEYDIKVNNVISHKEGHDIGIASNHGDIDEWFHRFNFSMDKFRKELSERLENSAPPQYPETVYKVNDYVNFLGGAQYNNYNTDKIDQNVKTHLAIITDVAEGKKHPYHIRKVDATGKIIAGLPYGWVDADTIVKIDNLNGGTF